MKDKALFVLAEIVPPLLGACVVVWILSAGATSQAAPDPVFKAGETYVFVWRCMPPSRIWENPCTIEILEVKDVRSDGWLRVRDARDKDKTDWFIWPENAEAVTRYRPKDAKAAND